MWFGILGPLEVTDADRSLKIGGSKLRTLLAALLVQANEVVSADRLTSILWPSSSSKDLLNALQSQVSRLRTVIDPAGATNGRRLTSRGAGYLLRVGDDELDALAFESRSRDARDALAVGDWQAVAGMADQALGCWRGNAVDEFRDEEFARARATQLEEHRLLTLECRVEAGLMLGEHRELVGQLEELTIRHPLRESLWCQLIVAHYRSGRQSDALRAYDRVRGILTEELGIDPGGALVDLQRAVLDQDPSLDWHPPESATKAGRSAPVAPVDLADSAEGGGIPAVSDAPASGDNGATVRHNLPHQLTSFVGRATERRVVAEALARSRLVTLAGSGGCGKTRLALAVAEDLLPQFPGGAWFVDFAQLSDPASIDRALATTLGVDPHQGGQLDRVCQRIGREKLLLVLDNCEHLVEAVALAAEQVLRFCPEAQILATSREELRIAPELVWRIPGLSLPTADDNDDGMSFLGSEAVQLFIQRGSGTLVGFAPTGEALRSVAKICRRLDGIPLAIELAAALVGSLPLADIAERLDDRFRLLTLGHRHSVERHRTLRATLDWSFDLLDEPAQALFVRLAVFVGDFPLAAAEAVAGTESDPLAVARGLRHLVATSMLSCVAGSEGADRYRMLETVKQYAQERLEELDEADEVRWRHARYCADFAEDAQRHVHGRAAPQWLARVVSELPSLRTAVAWAIEHDDVETGLRLTGSLYPYFDRMGLLDEVRRWLDVWLERRAELPSELRLRALTVAGNVALIQGRFSDTRQVGEEGVALARRLDDGHQLARALIVRGSVGVYEGDVGRADECLEEAEALCTRLGDRWGVAWTLSGLGVSSRRRGHLERANGQLTQAMNIFRSVGDRHGQVLPLVHLGLAALEEAQPYDALALVNEAFEIAEEVKDRRLQHIALCMLGRVELSLDHRDRAREMLVHSIRGFVGFHHWLMVTIALEGLARVAQRTGHHGDAVALLGFTERMRERWQLVLSPARERERAHWLDDAAKGAISPEQVQAELGRGRGMSFDDAVELAELATMTSADRDVLLPRSL